MSKRNGLWRSSSYIFFSHSFQEQKLKPYKKKKKKYLIWFISKNIKLDVDEIFGCLWLLLYFYIHYCMFFKSTEVGSVEINKSHHKELIHALSKWLVVFFLVLNTCLWVTMFVVNDYYQIDFYFKRCFYFRNLFYHACALCIVYRVIAFAVGIWMLCILTEFLIFKRKHCGVFVFY